MPICMGILCERCRRVHFISCSHKSTRIAYDRKHGYFKLHCGPPCSAVTFFYPEMLKPYSVEPESLAQGHAEMADCYPILEPGLLEDPKYRRDAARREHSVTVQSVQAGM